MAAAAATVMTIREQAVPVAMAVMGRSVARAVLAAVVRVLVCG